MSRSYTTYLKHIATTDNQQNIYIKPPIFEIYKYQIAIRLPRFKFYIGWWVTSKYSTKYLRYKTEHKFGYRYEIIRKAKNGKSQAG